MTRSDRLIGSLFFLFGCFVVFEASKLEFTSSYGAGSGFFPYWLGVTIVILGAVVTLYAWRNPAGAESLRAGDLAGEEARGAGSTPGFRSYARADWFCHRLQRSRCFPAQAGGRKLAQGGLCGARGRNEFLSLLHPLARRESSRRPLRFLNGIFTERGKAATECKSEEVGLVESGLREYKGTPTCMVLGSSLCFSSMLRYALTSAVLLKVVPSWPRPERLALRT